MTKRITPFIAGIKGRRKAESQPKSRVRTIDGEETIEALTEEGFAAALSSAVKTGVPVCADADLIARFGIADHGEELGDLRAIFPDVIAPRA